MQAVTNVIFAGLGGQGVLKAADILAHASFHAGLAVKQSELHGMSQRGGSVTSDVRLGREVISPMVPRGEADYLVVFEEDQLPLVRAMLRPGGRVIDVSGIDPARLPVRRSLNIALLGCLSGCLEGIGEADWQAALVSQLPPDSLDLNRRAFALGRGAIPAKAGGEAR